jgi:hypothetical protein
MGMVVTVTPRVDAPLGPEMLIAIVTAMLETPTNRPTMDLNGWRGRRCFGDGATRE